MADRAPAPAALSATKGQIRVLEPSRAQLTIARRSAQARATVPDLELDLDVDMSACAALRHEQGYSVTAMLVKACALALREVPRANGAYRDGRFELYSRVNVGVTILTEDAYASPTVLDADRRSLGELTEQIEVLARRARRGELTPPELAGATFTLSNLGMYGVTRSTTILSPAHAGALVAGAIREVPVVRGTAIVPGQMMTLTLACDHRILYGTQAAHFLAATGALLARAAL